MHDFLPRFSSGFDAANQSWLSRIRENVRHIFVQVPWKVSFANGAPLHLLKLERSSRASRAQSASLAVHFAILTALVLLALHPPNSRPTSAPPHPSLPSVSVSKSLLDRILGNHPNAGAGSGGGRSLLLATHGSLPHLSSIVLVKPSLPQRQDNVLPVPPTIFDPSAPPVLTPVDNIGLPWMKDVTNAPGPGKGHTLGNSDGDSLGDSGKGPAGDGKEGIYQGAVSMPSCAYCPYPTYTEEGREAKVQGTVTLRVLVGADGRASQIQLVKGLGFNLDERAAQTVRGWRFTPARDASKRAVPAWVIVETVFRLF